MKPFIAALLVLSCVVAHAGDARSIKVTAKSEIKVAPDEVVIQLDIDTHDEVLLPAKRDNDRTTAEVLALNPLHSIPSNDVKVVAFHARPRYIDGRYGVGVPVGYEVGRSIEVRITDFDKIDKSLSQNHFC